MARLYHATSLSSRAFYMLSLLFLCGYVFYPPQYHPSTWTHSIPFNFDLPTIQTEIESPENDKQDVISSSKSSPSRYVVFAGTRPEIIKTAPVIQELKRANLDVLTVFTGQHPDIDQPFMRFWDVDFDVILSGSFSKQNSPAAVTRKLISEIETAVPVRDNDVWIVQGETSTVFAVALVAFLRRVPMIHLEAGLRTNDMSTPFPEEFHRLTLSLATALHIAPTSRSESRLVVEGIEKDRVFNLGNSVIDAVRLAEPKWSDLDAPKAVTKLTTTSRVAFVTLHRRENAEHFESIYGVMGRIGTLGGNSKNKNNDDDIIFVVTVHPNPAAGEAARRACAKYMNMICLDPLDYAATQWMLDRSFLLITDSGDLQEEATWYSTPTLVLRSHTERTEAIEAGISSLVPPQEADWFKSLLRDLCQPGSERLKGMSNHKSFPFGDGYTGKKLVALLQNPSIVSLIQRPIKLREIAASSDNTTAASQLSIKEAVVESTEKNDLTGNHEMAIPPPRSGLLLPPCNSTRNAWWIECNPTLDEKESIDVVLTVYKRKTLVQQLKAVSRQTLRPSHVWIIINGEESQQLYNLTNIIETWKRSNPTIPIDIMSSSFNTKYHGRFHMAYAVSDASYVSIWDNDIDPHDDWLEFCVNFSALKHNHKALVGCHGRRVVSLPSARKNDKNDNDDFRARQQIAFFDRGGLVDFVGRCWTLRRELLRYYVAAPVYTHATGEDMQLSFALQQHGIPSYFPKDLLLAKNQKGVPNLGATSRDEHSTYLHAFPYPRQWLICKIMQEGFQPLSCSNCHDASIVEDCLKHFETKLSNNTTTVQ